MFRDDPVDVTHYALLNFIHNPYDFKGGYYDVAAQHLIVLLQDCYYEYKRVPARMWKRLNVIVGAMSAEKYNDILKIQLGELQCHVSENQAN